MPCCFGSLLSLLFISDSTIPAAANAGVAWLFLFVAVVLCRAVRHILTLAQGVCQGEKAVAGNVAGAGKNGLPFIAAVCALPGSFARRIKGKFIYSTIHMSTKGRQHRIFPILQALSKKTPACAGVVV